MEWIRHLQFSLWLRVYPYLGKCLLWPSPLLWVGLLRAHNPDYERGSYEHPKLSCSMDYLMDYVVGLFHGTIIIIIVRTNLLGLSYWFRTAENGLYLQFDLISHTISTITTWDDDCNLVVEQVFLYPNPSQIHAKTIPKPSQIIPKPSQIHPKSISNHPKTISNHPKYSQIY